MRAGGRFGRTTCPLVLTVAAVAAALLSMVPPSPVGPARAAPFEAVAFAGAELIVSPADWWMPAGNATTLSAAWIDLPPGCVASPLWYRWTITAGATVGFLNSTTSENATFDAASAVSGTTTVRVRSAAVQECGDSATATVGTALANVTVDAPLRLANITAEPPAVPVGVATGVQGAIYGGAPPYSVRVAWGDGTVTNGTVEDPGEFRFPHAFPAGTFRPSLVVTDSAGLTASGTVDEEVSSSDTIAVGISGNASEVDTGLPVAFSPEVLDVPNGSFSGWSCGASGLTDPILTPGLSNFSCAFSQAGAGSVVLEVLPVTLEPPVSGTLTVAVEPRPVLAAFLPTAGAEVGQPCAVDYAVQGGVPPFELRWSVIGTSESGSFSVPTDGEFLLPLVPARPGSLEVDARVVDSDGVSSPTTSTGLLAEPVMNVTMETSATVGPDNVTVGVEASVTGGAPPFLWVVTPDAGPIDALPEAGQLGSAGSIDWQGSYVEEGNITGGLAVVDADGAWSSAPFDVPTVPALSGRAEVVSDGGARPGGFALVLDLTGGLPPFRVNVTASTDTRWNLTDTSDGTATWALDAPAGGVVSISVHVTDALGVSWNETRVVPIVSPSSVGSGGASGGSGPPLEVVVVAGVVALSLGGALGYLLLRRRRRHTAPGPSVDAVAVLRDIIEPADGVDRSMVELLADEAGVPIEEAHATIDRLIADGTLRSQTDPDGGEILAWSVLS